MVCDLSMLRMSFHIQLNPKKCELIRLATYTRGYSFIATYLYSRAFSRRISFRPATGAHPYFASLLMANIC